MTELELIKKITNAYSIEVGQGHKVIQVGSLPSVIETIKNYLKNKGELK